MNKNNELKGFCENYLKGDRLGLENWFASADESDLIIHKKKISECLGITAGDLKKIIRPIRGGDTKNLQGKEMKWPKVDPWPERVDGASLLDEIHSIIRRHIFLKSEYADTIAVWVIMTWLHSQLDIAPFLNITSATKRCGKTTLLDVINDLVKRPFAGSGRVTSAVLFRLIEAYEPTLLLDESDTFLREDCELQGIICGSQRRSMAFVPRCVGDNHEVRRFSTWCPKALVGTGRLKDTVTDRSIIVELERRTASDPRIESWRHFIRKGGGTKAIKRKIKRWTNDHLNEVLNSLQDVKYPKTADDRSKDSWEALLAIAKVAGGDWPDRLYQACALITSKRSEETYKDMVPSPVRLPLAS